LKNTFDGNTLGRIFGTTMQIATALELTQKKCLPCEGGVEPCTLDHSRAQLASIPAWSLHDDGRWIGRQIRFKNFVEAVTCVNRIADIAEAEAHHPDLHITGYRVLGIEITTHAIGGLSENDFVLAAKIDQMLESEFPTAKVHP
jgi:4a-hydroxytetrahydrobiopterin dehydratase